VLTTRERRERMRVVAVVAARKGSERYPGKHLVPVAGIPLVVYSIRAALASKVVDRVFISTDDEEIGRVGVAEGAIYSPRPAELAGANVSVRDAWFWTVEEAIRDGYPAPDYVVGMYGNSPFDRGEWIREQVRLLERVPGAALTLQLGPVGHHHPNNAYVVDKGQVVSYVEYKTRVIQEDAFISGADTVLTRERTDSQMFTPAYTNCGMAQVYRWPFQEGPTLPVIRDKYYFDIHDAEDFALAEWMLGREGVDEAA
jgi:CMP-N,N'-diacetyllegionaminic acid synthase